MVRLRADLGSARLQANVLNGFVGECGVVVQRAFGKDRFTVGAELEDATPLEPANIMTMAIMCRVWSAWLGMRDARASYRVSARCPYAYCRAGVTARRAASASALITEPNVGSK